MDRLVYPQSLMLRYQLYCPLKTLKSSTIVQMIFKNNNSTLEYK